MVASDIAKRAVPCGSLAYWAIVLSVVPCAVATWLIARHALLAAPLRDNDAAWTQRTTLVYPLISTVAGLIAGMLGVGGGIVKVRVCEYCVCFNHLCVLMCVFA